MAGPNDTRHFARDSSNANAQRPSLKEYTKAHSASSNDCDWLHEIVSSDAILTGKINPKYSVRVYYKETEAASTSTTKDFETGSSALLNLQKTLDSKY
ncbi:hypothetical protein MMC27_000001, partial [Xylographa pallens]|nr:hypothetical protein [Xylographa pallens]